MTSLGTPESPSIRSPIPGTSKGAQPHCPKKCDVSACYSVPLAHPYSNHDTPTANYCPPKRPSTGPNGRAGNATLA